jgi:hypothetical protein
VLSARKIGFELVTGEKLRPGGQLRALCGNARCVNPDHMEVRGRAPAVAEDEDAEDDPKVVPETTPRTWGRRRRSIFSMAVGRPWAPEDEAEVTR